MALPCFSLLRYKFYDHRIKIIPDDIYDYLNYESLAHMIMCDGSFSSKGLTLNLQSFTLKELILLLNVLKIKFDLDCTIHKSRHQYVLYIRVKSVNKLYKNIYKYKSQIKQKRKKDRIKSANEGAKENKTKNRKYKRF